MTTQEPQVNWSPDMMVEVLLNEPDDFLKVRGKHANLTPNDVQRRNRITKLLSDWGLISIVKEESCSDIAPLNQIKVLSYKDKGDWILEQKYNIGKKNKVQETTPE